MIMKVILIIVKQEGTHDERLRRDGVYAAMWREQERARGWRLGGAATSNAVPCSGAAAEVV